MVDRINLLGTVRLYAMKNFSVIRDADVRLRIYGQLLDKVMSNATDGVTSVQHLWWKDEFPRALKQLGELSELGRLQRKGGRWEDPVKKRNAELNRCKEAAQRGAADKEAILLSEQPLMLYRRLLHEIISAYPRPTLWSRVFTPTTHRLTTRARDHLDLARTAKSRHDEDLAQINRDADIALMQIKTYIDELGRDAIGGLPFRINRSRYYAEMYRDMVKTLRVGNIDTWWDYEQLASRGVEPPLKFIDNVGTRLEALRTRLRDAMEAVQTSAIANQTEATRDNTFQLEVIARGIHDVHARLGNLQVWVTLISLALFAIGVILGNPLNLPGIKLPK